MKKTIQNIAVLFISLTISGCGGDFAGVQDPASGALSVSLTNSKSSEAKGPIGTIQKYKILIEGADIPNAIETEFHGDARFGVIENIPVGEARKISVEGTNSNGELIRAGEIGGVDIGGGDNEARVVLESVPVFTNLKNDNLCDNARLHFSVYSDAPYPVQIEEINSNGTSVISDQSLAFNEINPDESTGRGSLRAPVLPPGPHEFIVRDLITNRSSKVRVRLFDGTKLRAAPFFVAVASDAGRKSRLADTGHSTDR